MPLLMSLMLLTAAGTGSWADVSYVEEIVNSGLGPKKTGARRTTNQVYIKGQRQRVHSEIETSKEQALSLSRQGQALTGSTILQLDRADLYQIDHTKQTFTQEKLPAAKRVGTTSGAAKRASKEPDREVTFRIKELPDTTRIAGILCHKAAAEMRVRHYQPGTKKVRRENRYLYQAWVAKGFPGYGEIESFRQLQARKTSHPSLIGGGLEQIENAVADYDELTDEIKALEGFPMQSVLKVYTKSGKKKEKQIFQLSRKVTAMSYTALSDTLFEVSKGIRRERK